MPCSPLKVNWSTLWRKISPSYPGSNNKPANKQLWKQTVSRALHSVISQKTELFIATAVRTSNSIYQETDQHIPKSRITWKIRMFFSNWQELSFPFPTFHKSQRYITCSQQPASQPQSLILSPTCLVHSFTPYFLLIGLNTCIIFQVTSNLFQVLCLFRFT
jgi:hypothetical protein